MIATAFWRKTLLAAGSALVSASLLAAPALAEGKRGGTLRLLATAGAGSVDPQINYTLRFWQIYQSTYDGLLAFKKAQGSEAFQIVPDLAEAMPKPEDGGKTYVFKLRKGIKFSNGQDVTVKDVVASFQRVFKITGPTAGTFYNVIVGADACLKTPDTCTLDGGVVADEAAGTVTFHLTAPDSEFFNKLALPHAAILPADSPAKDSGVTPLPGTGPYMITAYDPKKQLKLVRNPHFKEWSADAQPDGYVDEVNYDFGLPEEQQVTAVANNQADWMFDQVPSDRLAEVGTKYSKQLFVNPLTAIYYLALNVNIPPFDNIKARQAVNFAIDRNALVKIYGGSKLASPACQILPPGFPGHEPYCPYTKNPGTKWSAPDLDKAKQLMKDSGTAGQKVTFITDDTEVGKQVGTYIQGVLSSLGYDATVKSLSSDIQYTYIQNSNNKAQISYTQWFQDYPTASDFLNVLYSCSGYRPGSDNSPNIAGLCDKDVDAAIAKALDTAITDEAAANKQWAEIDRKVTDLAAAVVMFNPKRIDFVSKRVQNFVFGNQFQWVWAKSWLQ